MNPTLGSPEPGTASPNAPQPPRPAGRLGGIRQWLGAHVVGILWANLIAEAAIIVTGGLVRLTGSGLGCPTWPQCVDGSLTPTVTQEQGYHKYIEFGNRTLTGVLGVLAVLALLAVVAAYPRRKRMIWLAAGLVGGVLSQAVVGGITVRTGLNPWIVAFHFLCSILMVAMCVMLLRGARDGADGADGPGEALVPSVVEKLGWATAALGAVVIVLGTIVTGSGPHSGDAKTPARTGFDPRLVSWIHADTVMVFLGLVIAMMVAVKLAGSTTTGFAAWRAVLLISLAQGAIGYAQYFLALPWLLVLLHMLGSTLLTIALTYAVTTMRRNPI